MKLYKLESLRGFAALYVVLHHSLPHSIPVSDINVGNLFRFGQEAVILFFLLSGFVINYAYQTGGDRTFRTYFFKRFARIYIPLLFIFGLGYAIECSRVGGLADPNLKDLILNILMLQDVGSLKPNTVVDPYMHNSPLWSLSYEWWFYMLFFPIATWIKSRRAQSYLVYLLAIFASLFYLLEPGFVARLFVYFAIWWVGVDLSSQYIASGKAPGFTESAIPIIGLLSVCAILAANVYLFVDSGKTASIGVHPFLELRHAAFALLVLVMALMWSKMRWRGFDVIFKPFLFLAPVSYVMYISHQYLIVDAQYLSFIGNPYFEWAGYFIGLLVFSYVLELWIYPYVRQVLSRRSVKAVIQFGQPVEFKR